MTPDRDRAGRRRRAGLANGSEGSAPAAGSAGRGNGTATARAQLRRRRASSYRSRIRTPRRRSRVLRVFLITLSLFAAIGASAVGAVFAGYNAYKGQLPDAATITDMEYPIDTSVYDASGQLMHVFHDQDFRHVHVALDNVSPLFRTAIVDVEDRHFFTEPSWDLPRLIEAGVNNVTHSSAGTQGASTITEQLAKISLYGGASPPRSLDYKIKEIVLGNEIELNFTKKQILEMYLNRIFFGNFAVGVETASELYFQKPASQLDLAQASMLAGLPQSPSAYDPLNHDPGVSVNPLAKLRQRDVLSAMVANGDITAADEHNAYAEVLTYHAWNEPASEPTANPDFIQYLKGWLDVNFPQYKSPGGYRIYTTLDPLKQNLGYTQVHTQVLAHRKDENMSDGSLISLDPQTGEILAMVGTWDYSDPDIGQFYMDNRPLIPGSTIKLFTYTAAIASGKFAMNTPILDGPYAFPLGEGKTYSPLDYDRHWHGICELKQCLGNSFNMPAVKAEYATGIDYITNLEIAMGVTAFTDPAYPGNRPLPNQWAATLGSLFNGIRLLDLADGAATLADLGMHHDPMPVSHIVDGATGKTVFTYNPDAAGRRVVPNNVAYIMDEITSNDTNRYREFGANGPLTLSGRRVSAKTGTADLFLDNLTVGWTPTLLTAVWVGSPNYSCLKPTDYNFVQQQIKKGHLVEPGATTTGYWFSPQDVRNYGLQPINHACGPLNGIVSGYSGAAPIWHNFMTAALKGVPATWYTRPTDIIASGPGDNADFFLPTNNTTNCKYYAAAPDPTNACTYAGPSAPTPTPSPSPSPSPSFPFGPPTLPPVPSPKP